MADEKSPEEWRAEIEERFALEVPLVMKTLRADVADRLDNDAEHAALDAIRGADLYRGATEHLLAASRQGVPRGEALDELIALVVRRVRRAAEHD